MGLRILAHYTSPFFPPLPLSFWAWVFITMLYICICALMSSSETLSISFKTGCHWPGDHSPVRLDGQWIPRIHLSPLPQFWDYYLITCLVCCMGFENQTQVLLFTRQALYRLSYFPKTSSWFPETWTHLAQTGLKLAR